MKNKKEIPELIQVFKEEFNGELSMLNVLVEYELLILEIGIAIDENSDNSILGSKIRVIMDNWKDKHNG